MKSKVYIISEIRQLLEKNRGFCEEEIEQWVIDNEKLTVCQLLELKNDQPFEFLSTSLLIPSVLGKITKRLSEIGFELSAP